MRSLAAALLTAVLAGTLPAAAAFAAPASADSSAPRAKPFGVMLRSAVVPGWGQFYNRKYAKGVVVVAGEGFLAYKAWDEFRQEKDAAAKAAVSVDDAEYQAALGDRALHENRKINWIWWGVAAHFIQMVDAYVDAHLASFEADFGPPEAPAESGAGGAGVGGAGAPAESPRFTLALRTRF